MTDPETSQPLAFMSYVRFDDEHDDERLSKLAELLSREIRAQTGRDFPIFQDRRDIKWGEHWESRIESSLDSATFLIPIITPAFFRSTACRAELERFAERERQLARRDLILPAVYIAHAILDDVDAHERDELLKLIGTRQRAIWTELRYEPLDSPDARRALASLAAQIGERLERIAADAPSETLTARARRTGHAAATKATVTHFAPSPEQRYNYSFYEYFCASIADAKQAIYITGEGFEFSNREGREIAERFTDSFEQALSSGVSVVRIQTRRDADSEWAATLAALVGRYPDQFDLYVLRDKRVAQMSSVCVIDPDDERRSIVEIMLSSQRLFGVKTTDVAGTAVFIEHNQGLAHDLQRRIVSLTDPEVSRHPESHDETLAALVGTDYYFAYGSNMAADQMARRVPSAKRVGVGMLTGYQLVFNRRGSYRPGGVASIEETKDDERKVYGVIWEVENADLASLDEIEDPAAYTRRLQTVMTLDGRKHSCYVYEAIPEGTFEPDPGYVKILTEAALEADLPEQYLSELQALASRFAE
jgi:gamma-glutamylcyclotransferase (GGCT)/AIG2-like uncharacterized protein YtfP